MLKLIQVEFLKLRRRKFIWLMLLAALFMPLAAVFYFASVKGTGVEPIEFYKWTAFSYTPWIILPVVLGMLCTMLMYNENQYDMLKQLWIVPVNKMAYFFSKFAVVLVYSVCFMLIDGEYVPASAVQHDRHCYAGYSGCRNYPATQYSGGVPLHRRVGRCFCPAGWGCFEKEKVRCI